MITGIDNQDVLDQAFDAVKTYRPMDPEQITALAAKTQKAAADGRYELFKTTSHFDTTAKHPDWLGGDTPECRNLRHKAQDSPNPFYAGQVHDLRIAAPGQYFPAQRIETRGARSAIEALQV